MMLQAFKATPRSGHPPQLPEIDIGLVRVSLLQEPMEEVMLADIMAATSDFPLDHVVVAGNSNLGTSYKTVLQDGSALAVRRGSWIYKKHGEWGYIAVASDRDGCIDWPARLKIGIGTG